MRLSPSILAQLGSFTFACGAVLLAAGAQAQWPDWEPVGSPTPPPVPPERRGCVAYVKEDLGAPEVPPELVCTPTGDRLPREEAEALMQRLCTLYEADARAGGRPLEFEVLPIPFFMAHTIDRDTDFNVFGGTPAFRVSVTDGLLDTPGLTRDTLAQVLCHELGHIFGGFPFIAGANADEGQAHYYASKECMPRLLAEEHDQNATYGARLHESVRALCDGAWSDGRQQALCHRLAHVGEATIHLFHAAVDCRYPDVADLRTPDARVVTATIPGPLGPQCTLDAILAGALCDRKNPPLVVPGLTPDGKLAPHPELAAAPYACAEGPGARPPCWFAPGATQNR